MTKARINLCSLQERIDDANPVDFVVLWVDGSDPDWLAERNSFSSFDVSSISTNDSRFRDWGTLKYWFRGVEEFAPWVRKVFFVTWGHLPEWLNISHPKLRVVRHDEFIPSEYLPTFNSNAIELNLHRIPELSERFVLFNDDMFILRETTKSDFFVRGLPRDEMIERAIQPDDWMLIHHTNVNNVGIINKHFNKQDVHRKIALKVLSPKNGVRNLYNITCLPYRHFVGFRNPHIPLSHLRSTFEEVWEKEPEVLSKTSQNRFRTKDDVSHWLMRYWNLCTGRFVPRSPSFGSCFTLPQDAESACRYIQRGRGKTICVNDSVRVEDVSMLEATIQSAFDALMPDRSSFEC